MRLLERYCWIGIFCISTLSSGALHAETACVSSVKKDLSIRNIEKASTFYHDLGLCLLEAASIDEGVGAWIKWLYLDPQGALSTSDSQWFKEWEIARAESDETGVLSIKEVKKQTFGSSSTLALMEISDPLSLIYRMRVQMPDDRYVLRAAEKMEILIPGGEKTQVFAMDRYGFELIEIDLKPIVPEIAERKTSNVNTGKKFPWWVWAAVGGVSAVATGTTVWMWLESRDDIHLKGRVKVDDAS